jgi:hypothetical protein
MTRVPLVSEARLPNVPGTQFVSADGRHVLASEWIGNDSSWNKYRWTIYALANGARVGEIPAPFPQAPFFVSGAALVFEGRPFVRRVDDGALVREPLRLRAVELANGAEAWTAPLRDTAFYGPFPETDFLDAVVETAADPNGGPAEPPPTPRPQPVGGTWTAIGPAPKRAGVTLVEPPLSEPTGAIQAFAPDPANAELLYVGTVNGGIWKTTNATADRPNWVQLTDAQSSISIGAMDLDPADPTGQTVVAGIGRFSSFARRGGARVGLLRTTDGGASFKVVDGGGVISGKNISGLVVRGGRIAVSVNAADAAGVERLGIFRSTDAGITFTQISAGDGSASGLPFGITNDIARDPSDADRLFTGVVGANAFGGQNGVYRSTDGGARWAKVSSAAMDALIVTGTTNNLEFAVGRQDNVYASIVNAGHTAGIFRSGDGGETWAAMDVPNLNPGGQGSLHQSEAADPTNPNLLYIAGDTAMFRCDASQPSGSQCVAFRGSATAHNTAPHVDSREMAFDAAGHLLESDDGGIFRRTSPQDNTGDWFSIGNNIQAFEEHSMMYDTTSDIAMGGFQDNGVGRELVPGGLPWINVNGGDGGDVAVDTTTSPGLSVRYSSSQNLGGFRRQVFDANNVFQSQVLPALRLLGGGATPTFQFVTPIRLNAVDPRRLVIGATNGVYESFDQGETIRQIATVGVNGGGGHPLVYGGAGNADVLYVGSGDTVQVRTGAPPAALVASATYPGRGTGRAVIDLAGDPSDSSTAVAVDSASVFMTRDAGASWTNITGNLFSLVPGALRSIVHVRNDTGEAVAVGTNNGILVALAASGFRDWSLMGNAFPHAQAWDLDYVRDRDLLVAGTLGRGTWLLTRPFFPATLLSATFDAGTDGFTFIPDAFATSQPDYVSGSVGGGGLRVVTGGVDDATVFGMSGGWRASFTLAVPQRVTLSFDFEMSRTAAFPPAAFSDMLAQVDADAALAQARLDGDVNGGSTGRVSRVVDLGCLSAGSHTVTLGLLTSEKTAVSQLATLLLDTVAAKTTARCP